MRQPGFTRDSRSASPARASHQAAALWLLFASLAAVGGCQGAPSLLSEEEYIGLSAGPDGDACRESGDCACGPDAPSPSCPESACYTASCEATVCVYRAVDGCERCDSVADCHQGDACTLDACEGGVCVYPIDPCDDEDACSGTSCDPVDGCVFEDVCRPPAITVTASETAAEGEAWHLTGSFTGAPGETFTATVVWDVDAELDSEEVSLSAGSFNVPHVFDDNGTYTVRLTITDGADRAQPEDVTVTVANADPKLTADATASGDEGVDIIIHGHVEDAAGDTITLTSNSGDGEAGVLESADNGDFTLTHAWVQDGTYTVTLTATDEDGGETQRVVTVTVKDVLPTLGGPTAFAVPEGTEVVKTFTVADPGAADLFTWTVDYGDGVETDPIDVDPETRRVDVAFNYPNGPSAKNVVVHLYEGGAEVAIRAVAVTVQNVPPELTAVASSVAAFEGSPVTVVQPFTDPGAESFSVIVNWNESGASEQKLNDLGDGHWEAELTHTYRDDGSYPVQVTIGDGTVQRQASFNVTVANVAPTADLPATLPPSDEGGTFSYHGTALEPGDDIILGATVTWTVAGEDTLEAVAIAQDKGYTLSRTFAQDGEVTVQVDMHDDQDASSETRTLTVQNVLPHALDCPGPLALVEAAPFDRDCTFSDPGADPVSVTVDYDDGTAPVTFDVDADTRGFSLAHAWETAGSYAVAITLNDGSGDADFQLAVNVGNAAPSVVLDEDAPSSQEGATLTVSGAVVDATLDDTFTATLDWGDGGGPTALPVDGGRAFSATHVYRDDGDYALKIVVTDAGGATGQLTRAVPVDNLDPVIETGLGDGEVIALNEGGRLSRVVTLADAGLDDVLTASVDYKEGAQVTPINVSDREITLDNVYEAEGSYLVTIFAADGDGGTASVDLPVEVANVAPTISFATGPTTVVEGDTFSRGLTFVDPGGDELSVTVDWGDGGDADPAIATTTSAQVSHVYADNGLYTVVVSAFDGTDTAQKELAVTVTNAPPVVEWGSSDPASEGSPWQHTITVSDPGSADTFTGRVRWSGGGSWEGLVIPSAGALDLTHTFPVHGTYQVTVEVTDDDGGVRTASQAVAVADVLPVILVPDDRGPIPEGTRWLTTTTFTDPGAEGHWGGCINYDDGDGCQPEVWNASHEIQLKNRWFDQGTYAVEVHVVTAPPTFVSKFFDVEVVNVAPTVIPPAESPSLALNTVLDAGLTVDDPGHDDVTLTIDFGDGSEAAVVPLGQTRSLDLATLGHSYDQTGYFTVTVDADDQDGGTSQATFPVVVGNSPPVISPPSPVLSVVEGTAWHGQAAFTDPDNEDHWDASVDYGDGGQSAFVSPDANKKINLSHTYLQDGTYDVAVSVTDTAPQTRTIHFDVVVTNGAPTIALGAVAYTVDEAGSVSVGGTVDDPSPADTLTVTLDWGDGSPQTQLDASGGTFTASHVYPDSGELTLTATVDDGVDTATDTASMSVHNVAPTVTQLTPTVVEYGRPRTFSLAWTDPGADSWAWVVDWADGGDDDGADASVRDASVDHAFTDALGDHAVVVTVTDDDGDSGELQQTVRVDNAVPYFAEAAPTAITVNQGEEVVVTVGFDDPHPGIEAHVPSVKWRWGQPYFCDDLNRQPVGSSCQTTGKPEGASLTVDEVAKVITARAPYRVVGAHELRLKVRDEAGHEDVSDCATHHGCVDVLVLNVAPVIAPGVDAIADPDGDLTLDTSVIVDDPGDDETWSASVAWGDGQESADLAISGEPGAYTLPLLHTYDHPGIYVLTLSVDDGHGAVQRTLEAHVQANTCDGYAGLAWDRIWMGLGVDPADWHDPDNWWPVGVPGPADAVALCTHGSSAADKTLALGQDTEVRAIGGALQAVIDATAPVTLTVNGDLQIYTSLGGVADGSEVVLAGIGATYRLQTNRWATRVTGDVSVRPLPGSSHYHEEFYGAVDATAGKLRLFAVTGKDQRFYAGLTSAVSEDGSTGLYLEAASDIDVIGGVLRFTANPGAVTASSLADLSGGTIHLYEAQDGSPVTVVQERPSGLTGASLATGGSFRIEVAGQMTLQMDSPGVGADGSCLASLSLDSQIDSADFVDLRSDLCVDQLSWYGEYRVVPDAPGRSLFLADGAELNLGLGGNPYVLDLADMDIRLAGRADQAATLRTTGALIVSAGGSLGLRKGELHVGSARFETNDVATTCSAEAPRTCVLEQRSPNSVLDVAGDLSFVGPRSDYPFAYLSQGLVQVGGDLSLQGAYIDLSGSNVLELDGPAGTTQHADVGDVGQPVPRHLRLTGGGTLELGGGALALSGTLSSDGPSRKTIMDGAIFVGALDASGLVFNNATLALTGDITRMDDVVFAGTDPTADAFTLESEAPGQTATRLQFQVVPTTGAYLQATTASSADLTITDSAPAYGTPHVSADAGFTVTWGDPGLDGDGDGVSDGDEWAMGLNPGRVDSDGDGAGDGLEVARGTDPANPVDVPFAALVDLGLAIPGTTPRGLTVADVVGGPEAELVVTEASTWSVHVFEDTGGGGQYGLTTLSIGAEPVAAAAAADGLYISRTDDVVTHWTYTAAWSQVGSVTLDAGAAPRALLAWSPTTGPELLAGGATGPGTIWRLPPDLADTGTTLTPPGFSGVSRLVSVRDGLSAGFVAWDDQTSGLSAWEDGGGLTAISVTAPTGPVTAIAAGPIHGGTTDDLVVAESTAGGARLWLYTRNGAAFQSEAVATLPFDTVTGLAVADVDRDGLQDIIGAVPGRDAVLVWLQASGSVFLPAQYDADIAGARPTEVYPLDLGGATLCLATLDVGTAEVGVWCPE